MAETLQQLVQRRQREIGGGHGPISTRQVWLRGGGEDEWSYETVRRIVERGHAKIGDRVADRLAIALNIPVSKVLEAAGQRQRGEPFVLPARANRLSQTERNLIRAMIDGLLGAYADDRPQVEDDDTVVQGRFRGAPVPVPNLDKVAARRGRAKAKQTPDLRGERPDQPE